MQDVGAGVVAHGASPAVGIHLRAQALPHAHPAVERALVDVQAADRLLAVGDREQDLAGLRVAETPWSPI